MLIANFKFKINYLYTQIKHSEDSVKHERLLLI